MKVSELIKTLQDEVLSVYGDIEVEMQCACQDPVEPDTTGHSVFFIVPEEYTTPEDDTPFMICNLRIWPY